MWPFSAAAPSLESAAAPSACPVDPSNRSNYLSNSTPPNSSSPPIDRNRLSADREISSIPRWLPGQGPLENSTTINLEEPPAACPARSAAVPSTSTAPNAELVKNENWVYPSPKSFFDSLERKDRNPSAPDMPVVVPIHNAVNERVWEQVLEWEREAGAGESSKLVNFVGRPKDLSPRARWKGLIGYSAPFDRHDWIVDRPIIPSPGDSADSPRSIRVRYIIDFYTGRLPALLAPDRGAEKGGSEDSFRPNLAFYLDVRPAVDGYEGLRMRGDRFLKKWTS